MCTRGSAVMTRQCHLFIYVNCKIIVYWFLKMDDLIEIVRQYNVIYNTKHKQYKDIAIRTAIWEEIGQKLKQPGKYLHCFIF